MLGDIEVGFREIKSRSVCKGESAKIMKVDNSEIKNEIGLSSEIVRLKKLKEIHSHRREDLE